MTKQMRAFFLAMWEFRSECTTHFESYDEYVAYDWGRELAHKFTLRCFERD